MQNPLSPSQNKSIIKLAIIVAIINFFCIFIFFNGTFFDITDKFLLNSKFVLLALGLSWVFFFIGLKFLKSLSVKWLFLLFIVVRIAVLSYVILANCPIDPELGETWQTMVQKILQGGLFSEYSPDPSQDLWRMNPPLFMWWYTYNFFLYELNPVGWRIVNFLLEIGIFYMMIQIFKETYQLKENLNEQNFRVGLLFYIFSVFPIVAFILYPTSITFSVLLALIGFYYYLKSKTNPKYLSYAILFLSLCALTYYPLILLLIGVFLILIVQKNYKPVVVGLIELFGIFCIISLPMLINDALGFIQRLFIVTPLGTSIPNLNWNWLAFQDNYLIWNWLFSQDIFKIILFLISVFIVYFYLSENLHRLKTHNIYLIVVSIILVFSPFLFPWTFLWIFPIISITLIYDFKKFLKINVVFSIYLLLYYLIFAILFLVNPNPLDPNPYIAFIQILSFGESIGMLQLFQIFLIPVFQMGLIYIIYTLTKSKGLIFVLLFPCIIFITNNFLIWLGSLLY